MRACFFALFYIVGFRQQNWKRDVIWQVGNMMVKELKSKIVNIDQVTWFSAR